MLRQRQGRIVAWRTILVGALMAVGLFPAPGSGSPLAMPMGLERGSPEYAADRAWLQLLDTQSTSNVELSPDGRWLLQADVEAYPSLAELSQPRVELAGLSFALEQATQLPAWRYSRLTLLNLEHQRQQSVPLPQGDRGARVADFAWSPDSQTLALIIQTGNELRLHRYLLKSGSLERWSELHVSTRLSGGGGDRTLAARQPQRPAKGRAAGHTQRDR